MIQNMGALFVDKIRKKIESRYIYKCIIINSLIMTVFIFVGAKFETNDDVGMEFIVSGFYGEKSPYMVYSNYIIGLTLSFLYRVIPFVKWYMIFNYALVFVDIIFLSYVIDSILDKSMVGLIKYPLIFALGFEMYCNPQFTKIATLTFVAGCMLILSCFENILSNNKLDKLVIAVGIGVVTIGSMIRYNAIIFVIPFVMITVALLFFRHRENMGGILKCLHIIFVMMLVVCVTIMVNRLAYSSDSGWSEYMEWNQARSQAVDYELPEYWEATEKYEAMGLNASDFYMLRGWMFGDPDFFTVELMSNVAGVKYTEENAPVGKKNYNLFALIMDRLPERFFQLVLFCIMLYLIFSRLSWDGNLAIFFALLGVIVALLYCDSLGKIVNRVNFGLWISMLMVIIFSFQSDKENVECVKRNVIIVVTGLYIVMNLATYYNHHVYCQDSMERSNEYKERTLFVADDDRLYINDTAKNMFEIGWGGVFDKLPSGKNFDNVVDTASWLVASPIWYTTMHNKGVDNIFRDTLDKDIVYIFIDSRVSSFETYINEHYHSNAKFIKFREFSDGIGYYKLVSKVDNNALNKVEYAKSEDLSEIYSFISLEENNNSIMLGGTAYKEKISSYYQKIYVVVSDKNSDSKISFEAIRKESDDRDDDLYGKYGDFEFSINKEDVEFTDYNIEVDLLADGRLYTLPIDLNNSEVNE